MKRSKIQEPRTSEDPSAKQLSSWGGFSYSAKQGVNEDGMTLNDGPVKPGQRHAFDLLERTAVFGEGIVRLSKRTARNPTNDRLVDQLVGCGTSIGGNYCEANEGVSKQDFRYPISRCIKEAKETKFFLRMLVASEPQFKEEARILYREANELPLIFASMYRK